MKSFLLSIAIFTLATVSNQCFAQGPPGTGVFGTGFLSNTKLRPNFRATPLAPPRSSGTMSIESNFTVKSWNPRYYNQQIAIGTNRIAQANSKVDHLTAQYNQNKTLWNRQALLAALKDLKIEKQRLASYKRDWNNPLRVKFNNSAVEFKKDVVEKALRMGLFGREIHVSKNRDGSKRVVLWHGKPNYGGKPQDISANFN